MRQRSKTARLIGALSVAGSFSAGLVIAPLPSLALDQSAAPQERRSSAPVPADFPTLAAGAGLDYQQPEGFEQTPVLTNPLWPYEHSVHKPGVEIRYAIRPIERMEIAYDDPHSNAPDPDHIFPMMFQTLIGLLSNGKHSPSREYPPEQASSKFNADWAAAALFDLDKRFSDRYKLALMIAMHKNQMADAYTIYLFDDYETAKPVINATMSSMKFMP